MQHKWLWTSTAWITATHPVEAAVSHWSGLAWKKYCSPWGSSVTMQTRVPNQMKSLTEMMGVGAGVGEAFKAAVASQPALAPWHWAPAAMPFEGCLPARGRGCNVPVLGEPVRAHTEEVPTANIWGRAWVLQQGQQSMRCFPTHNLNLFPSESHFLILAPEADPMAANFAQLHQKPSTETATMVGCGWGCVPDPG